MRRAILDSASILLAGLTFGTLAFAGGPSKAAPRYDPAKETTIKATVEQVKQYSCPITGTVGTHLLLNVNDKQLEAHVGSSKFLADYNIKLAKGDHLIITGYETEFEGAPALLVRKIERENDVFFFRDTQGKPLW